MHWHNIIQDDAPTAPATGRVMITVEQARAILAEIGQMEIPAALTMGTLLSFAQRRHAALLADEDTARREWGPHLTFTSRSVRWDGHWTYGRTVTLRAIGAQVEMTWDSGSGRPSRFIAALLHEAGIVYRAPVRVETPRALRERLGLTL